MKKYVAEYLYVVLGAFIIAIGINMFLLPVNISTGGVSGIGTILYYTVKVPVWVTSIIFNAVLFFIGFRTLKKNAVVKTAVGILSLTVFLAVTENISLFTGDMLISSVFGGIFTGLGVGLTVLKGASTGGSDFAAVMINKKFPYISVAKILVVIDCIVIISSGIVFRNYYLMLYSLISLYICGKVTGYILVAGNFAKCIYIISEHNKTIGKYILDVFDRGVTGIESHGVYTGNNITMLMCVTGIKEATEIIAYVKSVDKNAFIVVSDVKEVHGNGFIKELIP